MYLRSNIVAVSFFILSFINTSTSSLSKKSTGENEQCIITLNTGEIINLSPLFSASQPMILSSTTSLYIYHPCTDVPLNAVQRNNSCEKGYGLCYFEPKTATDKPLSFQDALSNRTLGTFSLLAVNKEGVFRINQMMEPEIVYKHSSGLETGNFCIKVGCLCKIMFGNENENLILYLSCEVFRKLQTHYQKGKNYGYFSNTETISGDCNSNNGTLRIIGLNSDVITTYVRFECDEKVEKYVLSLKKNSQFEHILTLSSKLCCLHTAHHMSGWAVFFIILLVFLTIYFLGGILVLRFIRGATGVEMIPNHELWCKLPELARNGVAYVTSCGKNTPDSYEKI